MIAAASMILAAGCGLPQYAGKPTEASNKVSFSRGAFGADGSIEFGSDTSGELTDFKVKTASGGETTIGKLTMTQKPSETIGAWSAPMAVYDQQLKSYYTGLAEVATANWNGFAKSIEAAAPIASAYIGALGQAKLARAQRPQLVEQLAGLVMAGKVDTAGLAELDVAPDISAEVDRRVAARIAELQASAAATSQPSE